MAVMQLFALGIDEARDIFGANEQLAAQLRTTAGEHYAALATQPKSGLLAKILPSHRTPQLTLDPKHPTQDDIDALLAGRFISPDRAFVVWEVLILWLHKLSWGTLTTRLTPTQLNDIDFALACAEVPSSFALAKLMSTDAQLPLLPLPGMSVGYAKYQHVQLTNQALAESVNQLSEPNRKVVTEFVDFLTRFPDWAKSSHETNRPMPDLLVCWQN